MQTTSVAGPIRQALISVSEKEGIVHFAQQLRFFGIRFLSTGGTAKLLSQNAVAVTEVAEYTGYPEMLDGRVKTLHPKIYGGLLARRDVPEHMAVIKAAGIEPIDLMVGSLYPFVKTIAKPGCTLEEAIENIDIGGPTMLRAAAKNYAGVTVIVDPADYPRVLGEMEKNGGAVSAETRFELAKKVFAHTAAYDTAISEHLDGPTCCGMFAGESLCKGLFGSSMDWPRGQRSTSYKDLTRITCRHCKPIAEFLKRQSI